jgi:hypothetical protein
MDNPETPATLDTQEKGQRKKKKKKKKTTQKTREMGNTDPTKKPGMIPGAREGKGVSAS